MDNSTKPIMPFKVTAFAITAGCEYRYASVTSQGIFQGDDPMKHTFIAIITQLGMAILITTSLRRIFRPLNQPRFVAEMLTGIMLGPSVMQYIQNNLFQRFYNEKHTAMMSVFDFFSIFMFEYLVGVQTDLTVIKTSGKLGWILGISNFVVPYILSSVVGNFLGKNNPTEKDLLGQLAMFAPLTSYHVIVILLQDVKLLNSEIGRLATSSSIISSICSFLYTTGKTQIMIGTFFVFTPWDYIKTITPKLLYILFAVYVLRPMMFWMIKRIPEGKSLKQWHFVLMITLLLIVGFCNDILGYTAVFGAWVLGFVVPTGAPLGSGVLEKTNLFVSGVLLPSYLLLAGHNVNLSLVKPKTFWLILIVTGTATVGKILSAVVPMKVFGVPNKDAFALGLILSAQGFFNVIIVKNMLNFAQISQEYYTVFTLMIILNASIATPILSYIYDPSKRYINYKRRTIQHSKTETEFKTLVCIQEEDDVFGIMNVIKACYPTKKTPIFMYALDLMELVGRITPIFINHQFYKLSPTSTPSRTDRIIGAFQQFEAQQEGFKRHNFTAIAPYNSMHDEICTLALDKNVSFMLLPFKKAESIPMRGVKKNVLDKAPCSVGVLVNKRIIHSRNIQALGFHACLVFIGGPDSREALAFAMRMLENPATMVTVVRLVAEDEFTSDLLEAKLDQRAITELQSLFGDEGRRVRYIEVIVNDGAHTIEVLRSIDTEYDLVLVGRKLNAESPLVSGLADWSYEPELGIVGDILASTDIKSTAPVLVIQQQTTVEDLLHIDREKKNA